MKTKYHIFEVGNYKGGELHTYTNLDLYEFYEHLIDFFFEILINYEDDKVVLEYKNQEEVLNAVVNQWDKQKEGIYAGNGSYVAKWYESEGFILEELDKIKTLKGLSEYIWNKYYNF